MVLTCGQFRLFLFLVLDLLSLLMGCHISIIDSNDSCLVIQSVMTFHSFVILLVVACHLLSSMALFCGACVHGDSF